MLDTVGSGLVDAEFFGYLVKAFALTAEFQHIEYFL